MHRALLFTLVTLLLFAALQTPRDGRAERYLTAAPAIGNPAAFLSDYRFIGAREPWIGTDATEGEVAEVREQYETFAASHVDEREEPQVFQPSRAPEPAPRTLEWGGGDYEPVKIVMLDGDDLISERSPFPGIHPHTSDGFAPRVKGRPRVGEVNVALPNGDNARAVLIGDDPDVPWLQKTIALDGQDWLALCLECGFRDDSAPGELKGYLEVIRLDGRIGVQRLDSFRRGKNGVFLRMPPGQYQISWVSGAYTHWTINAIVAGPGRATQQR
jgi:hypothetical protein